MRLSEFYKQFPDEAACRKAFKNIREKEGIICKKCGCKEHYWKKDKECFQCKTCSFRTSLRSGTVMENSNLPFKYWLTAIAFLSATKKSISALELQRELGHKRYEPIWLMLHKIRTILGKRDSRYELSNFIEMDEAFFESVNSKNDNLPKKRGRGSQKQSKVLIAVESKPIQTEDKPTKYKHKPDAKVGYLKMIVLKNLESKNISDSIKSILDKEAVVRTDGYKGYSMLKDQIKEHQVYRTFDKEVLGKTFPWVHTAISNAKRLFLGIHHSIKDCYMQNYLNEYSYKFNRRYFGEALFDRMLVAAVTNIPYKKGSNSG